VQNREKLASADKLLASVQSSREVRYQHQLTDWEKERLGAKPKKPTTLERYPNQDLVGNSALPADWLVLRYGDLCSAVSNGLSQKPSGDSGYKIARISAVRPMIFDYDDYRFIACAQDTAAAYTLIPGDIVFTRYNGARRFVGVCALFRGKETRLHPDKLIRTRPDLPQLDGRFLEIALNTAVSRAWMETKIRTTAGQSGISGTDVKAMPVPVCSLSEQQEVVRILDEQFEAIEQNEREIDAALKKSEALRQAILQKAFTGRLVPQDPNDEPAAELLARIRAERG
jgi:type I restriction enzyme S subunit